MLRFLLLSVPLLVAAGCTGTRPPESLASYEEEITAFRADKDRFFLTTSDSPVPASRRDEFLPLSYYPVSAEYRVPATLSPFEEQIVIEMPTSTGQLRRMQRVGQLEFAIRGEPLTLTAFVEAGTPPARLFVPFGDLTNADETYPAGRYLDLDRTPTGIYDLDFNRAYHPYCYYDVRYDCPFPPLENRLQVPIPAGERLPPREASRVAN